MLRVGQTMLSTCCSGSEVSEAPEAGVDPEVAEVTVDEGAPPQATSEKASVQAMSSEIALRSFFISNSPFLIVFFGI